MGLRDRSKTMKNHILLPICVLIASWQSAVAEQATNALDPTTNFVPDGTSNSLQGTNNKWNPEVHNGPTTNFVPDRYFKRLQGTNTEWGPESNNARMSISLDDVAMSAIATNFSLDAMDNISGFIQHLRQLADPVSLYLWGRLTQDDQASVRNYESSAASSSETQQRVVDALNRIVNEPSLYTYDRFKGVVLRSDTRDLITSLGLNYGPVTGPAAVRANCLFLKDAYPMQLTSNLKCPSKRLKIGDPVILAIAFTNSSPNETFYVDTETGLEDDKRFSLVVISPSGRQLPIARSGSHSGHGETPIFAPGDSGQCSFRLSRICDFAEVGTYTVTASRDVGWLGHPSFRVVSSPLKITIVPLGNQ